MKLNRSYLFITASSLALCVVLAIQVNWILETARMKEHLFNEKANLVLSRTADALSSDANTRRTLGACIGHEEIETIDSLFAYYMKLYNVDLDYSFEIKPAPENDRNVNNLAHLNFASMPVPLSEKELTGTYKTCLDEVQPGSNKMELKLLIPGKEQFIMAEMRTPFIASVVLILLVLVLTWRTTLSLHKEKRISEHTTDFLNNMTHEFKTPLTNIALAGRMITREQNEQDSERIKHYSGIILDENEKLGLQVEQVLSMAALERGEIPLHRKELDIHQLINDAIKCMNVQLEHTGGILHTDFTAYRYIVTGDQSHLTNAFTNLVDNAIKYAKHKPELFIHTSNLGAQLLISVSDKGIGIAPKYHKKVFRKFFRVSTGNIHNVKGFGLGLAYVKTIIGLHQGTITLQSEAGKGTTFSITLPYA